MPVPKESLDEVIQSFHSTFPFKFEQIIKVSYDRPFLKKGTDVGYVKKILSQAITLKGNSQKEQRIKGIDKCKRSNNQGAKPTYWQMRWLVRANEMP